MKTPQIKYRDYTIVISHAAVGSNAESMVSSPSLTLYQALCSDGANFVIFSKTSKIEKTVLPTPHNDNP